MTRSKRPIRLLEAVIELSLLCALVAVPSYFNVDDVRAFEPDKAILLRDAAAALITVALVRLVLALLLDSPPCTDWRALSPTVFRSRLVECLRGRPTLTPMLLLAGVTLLATVTSMLPALSWNGSYARGQGALTLLAYLVLGLLVLGLFRTPIQARRLGTIIALAGVPPAGYGWVQHVGLDPLPWQQADLTTRVPGTLGNPIFLGALLVMTIPLALWRLTLLVPALVHQWAARDSARRNRAQVRKAGWRDPVGWTVLWSAVVLLQVGALYFTKSRGPFAGLLVALAVFGLALARAWGLPRLRRGTVAAGLLIVVVLLGANLLGRVALGPIRDNSAVRLLQWTPASSGSSEVRLDIWGPALQLIPKRPLLGCGPEAITWCFYPVYPTALRYVEAPNAVPDRTHNIFLDAAVETGLLGLAALLALLVTTGAVLIRLLRAAADPAQRALAAALLAALVGHAAEGFFGLPIVATDLLTWIIAGLAGALWAMQHLPVSAPNFPLSTVARRGRRAVGRTARLVPTQPAWFGTRAPTQSRPTAVGTPAVRPYHPTAVGGPGERVLVRQWLAAALVLAACLASSWVTWQVWANGAAADAADNQARAGADLAAVAQGNSGEAPLPPGLSTQPVLALRQFAAAASDQEQALADAPAMPQREEYLLDLGTTLIDWAQDAGQVGGTAADQAGQLYEQALSDFGQAAHLNPYDPDQFRDTGKAYERWAGLGHDFNQPQTWNQAWLARAALAFARAATLAPHHPDPLTSWAEVADWQGNPSLGLSLADRALALDPKEGDGYRLRAEAELALGRRSAAVADWRRALLDPNLGHPGETASQLALAEATWADDHCAAVRDAHTALAEPDTANLSQMQEIVHVDGPRCPGA